MAEDVDSAESRLAIRVLKYWLPVLLMIGAMYYASTDVFSGENTRNVIERIVLWLKPHTREHTLQQINYVARKLAHFTEYALLAGLLFRAFRADSVWRWRWRWATYSFNIAFCWALLDEFHQTFTRTRGGSIYDSLLDASGALFMLAVIGLVHSRKKSEG
ncbi:MAG TPA: VanZ family protein [Blastocatellia bacterium]|nr:VanZ family protein [Blastocatellia bacterium]